MNDGPDQEPTDADASPDLPPPGGDDTAPVAATPVEEPTATTPVPPAVDRADAPTATTPVATVPPAEPPRRKGVLVPVWALATVGVLVLLLVGGVVGYAIGAHDDGGDRVSAATRPGNAPGFGTFDPFEGNGNGGGNSNGSGNSNGNGSNGGGNSNGNGSGGNGSSPAPSGNGAFLGVAVQDSTDPAGAALVRVVADSPAADAGLRTGDVVTAVDGKSVADAAALTQQVHAHDVGDEIEVTYHRDGDSKTVKVTLGDRTPTSTN